MLFEKNTFYIDWKNEFITYKKLQNILCNTVIIMNLESVIFNNVVFLEVEGIIVKDIHASSHHNYQENFILHLSNMFKVSLI